MRCLLVKTGRGRASVCEDDTGDSANSGAKDSVKEGKVVEGARSLTLTLYPRYAGGGIGEGRCKAPVLDTLSTGLCIRLPLLLTLINGSLKEEEEAKGGSDRASDEVLAAPDAAEGGKEHALSLTMQLPQAGRFSSHLICRLLHSKQPLRDLRWRLRSLVTGLFVSSLG